jgi:hypothetical protein
VSAPVPPVPVSPAEPPPAGRGCGKKALIGCGVVALVLAAACLALILYARSRPEVITDFVMGQVESHFAADVTEEDKRDLRAAYAEFRAALRDRRVSREPLDRMRATIVTRGPNNEIHHEQVRDLIALFRQNAGPAPSPAAAPPSAVPSARPTP